MKWWTSDELADVYARLLDAPIEFVVIGGQAINLWSQHYQAMGRQPPAAWIDLLFVRELILDHLAARDQRGLLGVIERVADLAADEFGLRLWVEHSIAIEDSLRLPALPASGDLPKIANFLEKRWPQLTKRIETRRDRYRALVDAGRKRRTK